jgi:SCP-2 sterol transfer family
MGRHRSVLGDVAAFASREWIEQLDAAAVAVDPAVEFELEQVVTGAPGGDARYRLTLTGGRLRVRPWEDGMAAPDAVLTVGYAAAVDLATGRRTGSDAFEEGLVRLRGDLARLQDARAALAAAAEALAVAVRGTTYP